MNNALRFGAVAATTAVMGLASHSVKSEEHGDIPEVLTTPVEAMAKIAMEALKKLDVTQRQLQETRAQVADLVKRLEITETTCEYATSEDGCPIGCEPPELEGHSITW